jgi:hypothetical protein
MKKGSKVSRESLVRRLSAMAGHASGQPPEPKEHTRVAEVVSVSVTTGAMRVHHISLPREPWHDDEK